MEYETLISAHRQALLIIDYYVLFFICTAITDHAYSAQT